MAKAWAKTDLDQVLNPDFRQKAMEGVLDPIWRPQDGAEPEPEDQEELQTWDELISEEQDMTFEEDEGGMLATQLTQATPETQPTQIEEDDDEGYWPKGYVPPPGDDDLWEPGTVTQWRLDDEAAAAAEVADEVEDEAEEDLELEDDGTQSDPWESPSSHSEDDDSVRGSESEAPRKKTARQLALEEAKRKGKKQVD